MYKIAVLGDRESVLGFKALGLDVFFAENPDDAGWELQRLIEHEYSIIYITEQLAKETMDEIERYKNHPSPAIILIPGKDGSLGIGSSALKSAVEKAVGVDIF